MEWILFNFICEELHKSLSQKLRDFIDGSNLADSLCNTSVGLAIICVGCCDFCSKEFRFGLYADSIVLGDFLHVLGSIEGRFVSASNVFKQTLGLFCCYYGFVDPPWIILPLCMFGIKWCLFVDKGRQGRVILLVQSVSFLGRIVE